MDKSQKFQDVGRVAKEIADHYGALYDWLTADEVFKNALKSLKTYANLKPLKDYYPHVKIKGSDPRYLRVLSKSIAFLHSVETTMDENECIAYPNVPSKGAARIGCLNEKRLNPTYIGGKELADQLYDEVFYRTAEDYLDHVFSLGRVFGVTVRRKKGKSNDPYIRTDDFITFDLAQQALIDNIADPEWMETFYDTPKISTPVARRMSKPVGYKKLRYDVVGNPIIHDRTLNEDEINELIDAGANPDFFELAECRLASAGTLPEKTTMIIVMSIAKGRVYTYPIIWDHNDRTIPELVDSGHYETESSDGSSFDKHIPQRLSQMYSERMTAILGGVIDYQRIEDSADIMWYDESGDRLVSCTGMVKEYVETGAYTQDPEPIRQAKSVVGLRSGKNLTSYEAKDYRLIAEMSFVRMFFHPDVDTHTFLCFRAKVDRAYYAAQCKKFNITIYDIVDGSLLWLMFNTGDDHRNLVRKDIDGADKLRFAYRAILVKNFSDGFTKFGLPIESEGEYVADVTNLTEDGDKRYGGNFARKLTSFLAPEYSMAISPLGDGKYLWKDERLSFESRMVVFRKIPGFEYIWSELNDIFASEFGCSYDGWINQALEGEQVLTDVVESLDADLYKPTELAAIREVIVNEDSIHYKKWVEDNLPEDVCEQMFYNVREDKLYELYDNANQLDSLFDSYRAFAETGSLLEDHFKGFEEYTGISPHDVGVDMDYYREKRTKSHFESLSDMKDAMLATATPNIKTGDDILEYLKKRNTSK